MWAWADGGAAMVVGVGSDRPPIAEFLGAKFTSRSESNGHVLVRYGCAREPTAPPGADPFARRVSSRDRREVRAAYDQGYRTGYWALTDRLSDADATDLQQITPPTVSVIAAGLGFPGERVVVTGNETGHLGASDMVVGLRQLQTRGEIDGPIAVGASTAYACGTGMLVPPGDG